MKNLKIYFTSDMHGYLYPTNYIDKEQKSIGLINMINDFKKDGNTLIGEFELRLNKYINLKPNIIRSRLKGEDFVRTFKVRKEH